MSDADETSNSTDWEKAYKQLQANSQKAVEKKEGEIASLKEQLDSLKTSNKDLTKAVSEKDSRISALESDLASKTADLTKQIEAKDAAISELTDKVGKSEKALTRSQLILKYPNLAELEAEGLLPDTSDDLEAKLQKLSEKLGASADAKEAKKLAGAKPEATEGAGGSTSTTSGEDPYEIQRELAAMNPNDPKFAALERKYDELTADK